MDEKKKQLDIWSFQRSSNSFARSQTRPLLSYLRFESIFGAVVIDNKSVSFLIKRPMPVIEHWRRPNERKEIFTLKKWTQNKRQDTQCLKHLWYFFLFAEISPKYAFCLRQRNILSFIPYVCVSAETILQVKRVARGLMTFLKLHSERVKFLSGKSKTRKQKTSKSINLPKAMEKCSPLVTNEEMYY